MTWTKEPWKVTGCGFIASSGFVPIRTPFREDAFKEGSGRSDHSDALLDANARRIVACVNACAGIDTESLVADGYGDNWAQIAAHRIELMNQRDELLLALRRVIDIECPLTGNPTHAELVEHWKYEKSQGRGEADDRLFALAVIAKAEADK